MKQLNSISTFALTLLFGVLMYASVIAKGYPVVSNTNNQSVTLASGDADMANDGLQHATTYGGGGDGNNSHLLLEDESVVYPNPTDGPVNIRFQESLDIEWVQAFNTLGQRIHPPMRTLQENKTYRVDFSGFTPGIYFIRVKAAGEVHVKRVILK